MKRLLTLTVLGLTAAMLFALVPPKQAGATAPVAATSVTTAVQENTGGPLLNDYKFCVAWGPGMEATPFCQYISALMTGQVQPPNVANTLDPHLSISAGFAYYFHLSHSDVASAAYEAGIIGGGGVLGLFCAGLAALNVFAGIACGAYIILVGTLALYLMKVAAQKWDWYANWYCDAVQASSCPGNFDLNASNWWVFGHNWVYGVQDVGLTFAVAYWGQALGYTADYNGFAIS